MPPEPECTYSFATAYAEGPITEEPITEEPITEELVTDSDDGYDDYDDYDDYEHIDLIDELMSDPYFPEYISPDHTCSHYYQTYLEPTIDKILQGDFKSILDTNEEEDDEDYIYD